MDSVNLLSPSVLSFVGDAVYGLCVRTRLAAVNRPSGELHRLSVKFVNASSQADAYALIEPVLDENEIAVFKRGRNFHTGRSPKSSTGAEYHIATGLECVFGYLHLAGKKDRIEELFNKIWNEKSGTLI